MTNSAWISKGRARMLATLRGAGISDPAVVSAFAAIPREAFVPARLARRAAYLPLPLPIGRGQTLSQPYIVARMVELAGISPDAIVLDIGSGSGYQTAILARLCRQVHAVERVAELSERAQRVVRGLGIDNVRFHVGDGRLGQQEYGPYDAILVAATATAIPPALPQQLKVGGKLIIPVGRQLSKRAMALRILARQGSPQQLHRITRTTADDFAHERLDEVFFVPFVGA